ncbi:hypothetical protein [Rhizobium sp. SSA_523]|uniref:hypothetical protein n=1 Tax=Rhizobium sp. SSA_523 TaxID=2952477 RepID=UPI00209189C1|nr:hypothetical protein [Rhizobium sp. SSA_523]MCO5730813.1 hypothetical protein [Rhizobium sp. SSA_523]WKC24364.1 hypothetical protein QTJ18_09885 [Rhizobium sp. SSA_523]
MPVSAWHFSLRRIAAAGFVASVSCLPAAAFALSGETAPAAQSPGLSPSSQSQPAPLPVPGSTVQSPAATAAPETGVSGSASEDGKASIEILHDLSTLPEPVRAMRQALTEAAASGDPERLRPLMSFDADVMEQLKADGGDPVASFKSLSGDSQGLEILAIMLDILQTGAAHVGIGTPDEMYVWPYFVGKPINSLSAPERVELLRIITAGDLETMAETNNYNFYRIGITVDGRWRLFAGGD